MFLSTNQCDRFFAYLLKKQKRKMRRYLMLDLIVDFLGTIGDIFADIWVNKIVAKFKKK